MMLFPPEEILKIINPLEWFKYFNANPRYYFAFFLISKIFRVLNEEMLDIIAIISIISIIFFLFSIFPSILSFINNKFKKHTQNKKIKKGNLISCIKNNHLEELLIKYLVENNIQEFSSKDIEDFKAKILPTFDNEQHFEKLQFVAKNQINVERFGFEQLSNLTNWGAITSKFLKCYKVDNFVWKKFCKILENEINYKKIMENG